MPAPLKLLWENRISKAILIESSLLYLLLVIVAFNEEMIFLILLMVSLPGILFSLTTSIYQGKLKILSAVIFLFLTVGAYYAGLFIATKEWLAESLFSLQLLTGALCYSFITKWSYDFLLQKPMSIRYSFLYPFAIGIASSMFSLLGLWIHSLFPYQHIFNKLSWMLVLSGFLLWQWLFAYLIVQQEK